MIPELSITENIFLGKEIVKNGLIDWDTARQRTTQLLERVGLNLNPNTLIKNLGVGQQQLVEIAKALSKNVKLLILDEPTSALNEDDSANLLELMRDLKSKDITCIMISHKLKGLVLLAAVAFDVYNKRPGHVSITKRLFNLNKAETKEGSPAEKKS